VGAALTAVALVVAVVVLRSPGAEREESRAGEPAYDAA
jgi:hypothetical protein